MSLAVWDKFTKLRESYDPLTIFSIIWAIYSLFHMHYDTANPIEYRLPILVCALLVLARPGVPLLIGLLSASLVFEHWMGMPTGSNHTMMSFLFSSMIVIAVALQAALKRGIPDDPQELFAIIAPAGRMFLITMYFFGVFHKINTDFLNPDSSCASALVSFFVFFGANTQIDRWMLLVASYGTLVIETIILIALLFPRTRYWAVAAGVLFHFLISFSAYRNYIPFTLFSMAMHALFLDGAMLARFRLSPWWKILRDPAYKAIRIAGIIFSVTMFTLYANAASKYELDPSQSILIWIPFGTLLSLFIIFYDYPGKGLSSSATCGPVATKTGRGAKYIFMALTGVFFLSCFSPYIGLKSGQSIAMFSNLHMENGVSNHLIITKPIPLFDNLDRSVEILSVSSLDNQLINYPSPEVQMARYAFEDFMSRHPTLKVTYKVDGEVHTINYMKEEQRLAWLKNPIARKFMVFEPIYMTPPKTCFESFDRYRLEYLPEKNRWFKKTEAPTQVEAPAGKVDTDLKKD